MQNTYRRWSFLYIPLLEHSWNWEYFSSHLINQVLFQANEQIIFKAILHTVCLYGQIQHFPNIF